MAAGDDCSLLLIDASGYIFRAYHALPPLTTSRGVATGAVLGFTRMVLKTLRELKPTHVALCFDKDSRKKRQEIDPTYKAHREAAPEDLLSQFGLIRRVASALDLPIVESEGWEADDVIASLAKSAREAGCRVRIVSSDKDLFQLISEGVDLFDPMKEKLIGPAEAEEKFGVPPSQMRDYLALVGDSVDNVAKVPGIGPKTAVELLRQFGDLDSMLSRLGEIKKAKLRETIEQHVETLKRGRQLVSLNAALPLETPVAALGRRPMRDAEVRALFAELEFFRLLQELPVAPPVPVESRVEIVRAPDELDPLVAAARESKSLCLLALSDGSAGEGSLEGLALAAGPQWVKFVRLATPSGGALAGLDERVHLAGVRERLAPLFSDRDIRKAGFDLKSTAHLLAAEGMALAGELDDVDLLSRLLNPSRKEHALADLSRERLSVELPPLGQIGTKAASLASQPTQALAKHFGAAVEAVAALIPKLWAELEGAGMARVAREIEVPLLPVLARMERRGIQMDRAVLARVSEKVDKACVAALAEVQRLAGRELNVGSTQQLAQVLYEELKLPVLKRGKTGPSTDQEVLEKLAEQHPLPRAILEYRNVVKLKNTYLDTLPDWIGPDGRLRTTFHQVGAATGRLSSTDPNLQNIPIRGELGREIRSAFVAREGHSLISADYSQIELRILAHIAGDAALVDAFAADADVHTRTAAEVFGVAPEQVNEEQRRAAKMVNYGIAYGLSPHGLGTRLGIPTGEAKSIIDRYFERYAGIRRYLEETVQKARTQGYVETLFGRRRHLPELASKNRAVAMGAERAAINMPIQGTAADLVKLAMLRVEDFLSTERLSTQMLLQVHDELVLESPVGEVEKVCQGVRAAMEGVVSLRVPLKVDVRAGHSWADAH